MKKNAISLVGYIVDFALEIASRFLLLFGQAFFSESALAVIGVSPFGLLGVFAFVTSHEIRRELLLLWAETIFGKYLYRVFGVFKFVGLLSSARWRSATSH